VGKFGIIMIVRDESDIIERNLRFHAHQGFDHFAIMDNNSIDGTRDIISDLSKVIPITVLDQAETDFRQDVWASLLAECLTQKKIDVACCIDADEFVSGQGAPLKEVAAGVRCPVAIPRQNIVPSQADRLRVAEDPLWARFRVARPFEARLPIMFRKMPGKMLFPLRGLRSIARGNHDVEHEIAERLVLDKALIRHFPVPKFERFMMKLEHARERFRQERGVSEGVSWHIRRWLALKDSGSIEEEYSSFFVNDRDANLYLADGTIVEDNFSKGLSMGSE